ncbi:DUF4352 domain-containing protein [Streptomyces sp. ISL-10]|uniref:DUF4352 domain-containing protein n=1 Tax=Streptomyces sp. ISL-10 TaxID=2819172 RepID=UPI0020356E6D|nr:DUF4352 domain-containing protein [Streptomyces sp. ISL-10]
MDRILPQPEIDRTEPSRPHRLPGKQRSNHKPNEPAASKDVAGSKALAEKKSDKPNVAHVGDTITLSGSDENLKVDATLKKWLDPAKGANEFGRPQDGRRWVAAQWELVNKGTVVYDDSPSNGAQVADAEGQRFQSWYGEITAGPQMTSGAEVPPGEKVPGWIVYEVPKDSKTVSVQFALDSGFADQTGQWVVK